jgi:TonB family protein
MHSFKPAITLLLFAILAGPVTAAQGVQTSGTRTNALTNKDVLGMLQAGLSQEIVIAKIKSSACNLDTSPTTLRELRAAHVPKKVILAMVQAPAAASASSAQVSANNPANTASGRIQNIAPDEMWRRVMQCVLPTYPGLALNSHIAGTVDIGLGISPEGDVANTSRVLDGPPLLAQSAMDAIRRWKFRPNVVQGEVTWSRVRALVRFNPDGTTAVDLAAGILADSFGDPGTPNSAAAAFPRPATAPECKSANELAQATEPSQQRASVPAAPGLSGTVRGRVLWNEQPVAGAQVYATSEYSFSSTQYGSATTDAQGQFLISGIPDGKKYLYVFGGQQPFWVAAVTPFEMVARTERLAADTYLCEGFDPVSPQKGESVGNRPVLEWVPYPDAADYAVRVLRAGQTYFIFSRGDHDPHIKDTRVQVDLDLVPGEYTWRVDAFNAAGHIIGCSYYPRTFTVATSFGQAAGNTPAGQQGASVPAAPGDSRRNIPNPPPAGAVLPGMSSQPSPTSLDASPGSGPRFVDGAYMSGTGGIGRPICASCPQPSYSDQARDKKISGTVVLHLIVTPEGRAANVQVRRSLGYGLDEKAVEAIQAWRFNPAVGADGKPVPVWADIEVDFRLK